MELPSGISSVSALDFSSATLCLAVGNESGLVRVYLLILDFFFRLTSLESHVYSLLLKMLRFSSMTLAQLSKVMSRVFTLLLEASIKVFSLNDCITFCNFTIPLMVEFIIF